MASYNVFNQEQKFVLFIDSESSENSSSDQESSDEMTGTLIPLKDIVILPDFLLPNFSYCPQEEVDICDIFKMDHRTIKEIWLDYVKS